MRDRVKPNPIERLRGLDPILGEDPADVDPDKREASRERAVAIGSAAVSEPGRDATRPRFAVFGLAVAAAASVAVGLVLTLGGDSVGSGPQPAFAQSAVRVAEGNPRLLVGEPGWAVSYAGEFEPDQGYTEFRSDADPGRLTIGWSPAEYYYDPLAQYGDKPGQWYRSVIGCVPEGDATPVVDCRIYSRTEEIDVLGSSTAIEETRIVDPSGEATSSFSVSLAPTGPVYVQIDGRNLPRERFLDALGSLEAVDVDTWLEALPASVVRPLDRPEVVDEMLEAVPVPPSVDVEQLKSEFAALSRYNLGAAVSGAVACGWLDQWIAATGGDPDPAAAREAEAALASARQWPILRELAPKGGWSQTVWEYAGQVRRGERKELLGSAGTEALPDGRVYELGPSYATGLGCDSERRTLRETSKKPGDASANTPPRSIDTRSVPVRSPNVDLRRELPDSGKSYPVPRPIDDGK